VKKNKLKETELALRDILAYVFKGQERMLALDLFSVDVDYRQTRHNYQRELDAARGAYVIYHNGKVLARTVRRPHTAIVVNHQFDAPSMLAQKILERVLYQYFPYARVTVSYDE
jgi:hypothetical protein